MFGWLSRSKNRCPADIGVEDFRSLSEQVAVLNEAIPGINQDLVTLNTAVNRIERKQNRWLDILNLKDAPGPGDNGEKADTKLAGSEVQAPGAYDFAGEPTEE